MKRYIAIDGRSGSGKTRLAQLLQEKLVAHVFHLDEYGNDYEPFVGIPKLIEALHAVQAPVVIFEGVGVFDPRFEVFQAVKILVRVPEEVRVKQILGRDVPRPDRPAAEWDKIFAIWDKAEAAYFTDAMCAQADVIVGEDTDDRTLESILAAFAAKAV